MEAPAGQDHRQECVADSDSLCCSESQAGEVESEVSFDVTLQSEAMSRLDRMLRRTADVGVQCERGFRSKPGHRCPTCRRGRSRRTEAMDALAVFNVSRARSLSPVPRQTDEKAAPLPWRPQRACTVGEGDVADASERE